MKPPMPLILRGHAGALPLADESVDLIVTSPPYFGLRDYGHDSQIGAEKHWGRYLDNLLICTEEMVRVLKPSGSIWINLGDKYSERSGSRHSGRGTSRGPQQGQLPQTRGPMEKSLLLIPERFRIACVDQLGLIARAVVVWSKPNGLPESVTDRVRRSHEDWVHLTRSSKYFSAVDEIREPITDPDYLRRQVSWEQRKTVGEPARQGEQRHSTAVRMAPNLLGKLPGSVWEIATQPLRVPAELGVDHFAAFPMELPRRLILGWSPREVCTACGEGRRPVVEEGDLRPAGHPGRPYDQSDRRTLGALKHGTNGSTLRQARDRAITGYACACPDTIGASTPGVVLDPFGGTGTSALVATMLGRRGISVDLSADYCRLAKWRANDPKERARAAGLDPDAIAAIPKQLPGQFDLFTTPA